MLKNDKKQERDPTKNLTIEEVNKINEQNHGIPGYQPCGEKLGKRKQKE